MAGKRAIPRSASDAIYERLIEVQESQAQIAREQSLGAIARDQILAKMAETLAGLARVAEARLPLFTEIHDAVVRLPEISDQEREAIIQAVGERVAETTRELSRIIGMRNRKLVWWVAAATFAGSFLGNGSRGFAPAFQEMLKAIHP